MMCILRHNATAVNHTANLTTAGETIALLHTHPMQTLIRKVHIVTISLHRTVSTIFNTILQHESDLHQCRSPKPHS